jgi:carnitine monooxygenase subunit
MREVPFAITNPERIPKERYYDEQFFRLENEHFWPRVWQNACRLEEIPEIGDWIEYKILDKSVILVRTADGVKAFHNACVHRGMKLADGCGNAKGSGFTCPFHGWRYDIDGRNTFIHGRQLFSEESLNPDELDLVPVRVELWGGCAFINFDADAAPLLDYIGPIARRLDPHNVADLKIEWRLEAVVPANWKLAMEAFMEGLHVMRTHPELQAVLLPGMDPYVPVPTSAAPTGAARLGSRDAIERLVTMSSVLSEGMAGMVHASDVAVMKDLKDTLELPDRERGNYPARARAGGAGARSQRTRRPSRSLAALRLSQLFPADPVRQHDHVPHPAAHCRDLPVRRGFADPLSGG